MIENFLQLFLILLPYLIFLRVPCHLLKSCHSSRSILWLVGRSWQQHIFAWVHFSKFICCYTRKMWAMRRVLSMQLIVVVLFDVVIIMVLIIAIQNKLSCSVIWYEQQIYFIIIIRYDAFFDIEETILHFQSFQFW